MSLLKLKNAIIEQHKNGVPVTVLLEKIVSVLKQDATLSHKTARQVWTGLESTLDLTWLQRQYMQKTYRGEFERLWKVTK